MRADRLIKFAALALALLLASCSFPGTKEAQTEKTTEQELDFETISYVSPYSEQDFELTDVLTVFAKEDGDYAVGSQNFGVDNAQFEALFNLILYYEKTKDDGEYDEYDAYFALGILDPTQPVRSQLVPESDLPWYAGVRKEALMKCFTALKCFEYAKERGVSPISRINEMKIQRVMDGIDEGVFGEDIRDYFGEEAGRATVRAAAALYSIGDDPSAFVAADDFDAYPQPDFTVDEHLNPAVAPAVGP